MTVTNEHRFSPVAKVLLRAQLAFTLFVLAQLALIKAGAFGAVPVIPVAFFTCANLLCLVATAPMFLFAAVLMSRRAGRTWSTIFTLLLPVLSLAVAWQVWKVCF